MILKKYITIDNDEELKKFFSQLWSKDLYIRVHFISNNYYYHPKLSEVSLIWIKYTNPDFSYENVFIIINHIDFKSGCNFNLVKYYLIRLNKLMAINASYNKYFFNQDYCHSGVFSYGENLVNTTEFFKNYYNINYNLKNINNTIPLIRHLEFCLALDEIHINNPNEGVKEYSDIYFEIEKNGIKLDKDKFIHHFGDKIKEPKYFIDKGKIYTQIQIMPSTTSRPSINFNGINFLSLNKTNGERAAFIPENDYFLEIDFKSFHPNIALHYTRDQDLIKYVNENGGIYKTLQKELNLNSLQEAKLKTFEILYSENKNKYPDNIVSKIKESFYQNIIGKQKVYKKHLHKYYFRNTDYIEDRTKIINPILQALETSITANLINNINKAVLRSKIVLFVYDSILIDTYDSEYEDILSKLKSVSPLFRFSVKKGNNYHELKEVDIYDGTKCI